MVKLNSNMDQIPKLMWHPIIQNGQKAGETLVAAELILKDKARILYIQMAACSYFYIPNLTTTVSHNLLSL